MSSDASCSGLVVVRGIGWASSTSSADHISDLHQVFGHGVGSASSHTTAIGVRDVTGSGTALAVSDGQVLVSEVVSNRIDNPRAVIYQNSTWIRVISW